MRAEEFIVESVKQRLDTTNNNGSLSACDSTQGYSVTDFNIRCFESWADYSRFLRSPKTSNRDTVKSWPTGVASFLSPTGSVTESKLTQGDRSAAKKFSADFKALDKRELVKIKVGNSISVMYTIIDLDRKEVELGGFVTPKTITNINLNQDKSIDTITFEDGSQFPERNELTNVGGQNITNTIFFPDRVSSSRAYTHIWMLTNALEGRKWTINRQSINEQGVTEDEPVRIKLGNNDTANAWIEKVYTKYPQTFQNNHVMPLGGTGDDQQFAMFELTPSFSKRGAVEVKWIQAYPLRQGVGSRAMQELQAMARADSIALTLFPWDKGQVSQAKLTKFYRGQGFAPSVKGSKAMQWEPK
jgi:hypothetical protein